MSTGKRQAAEAIRQMIEGLPGDAAVEFYVMRGVDVVIHDEETQLEFEAPVPARAILIPPEMYERIEAMAEAEFRTPDLQVRYLLHKGMEADKAVRG